MSNDETVFSIIRTIPRGRVATYGQIARLADMPNGARAVGHALKHLPVNTCLPWHRVVNTGGRISLPQESPNYRRQTQRLRKEGIEIYQDRISLDKFQWQT